VFIAHAPAGYLLGTRCAAWLRDPPLTARAIILACIAGSLLPDIDLLYFYLVDGGHTHHHKYVTHWPIAWGAVLALACAWVLAYRRSKAALVLVLVAACALVHLVMDTVVGDIWWLAPFVDRPYVLFHVQPRFTPWWLNFVLHWSFMAELALTAWAIALYRRRARRRLA